MIVDHLRFLMRIGLEATLLNGNAEGTVYVKPPECRILTTLESVHFLKQKNNKTLFFIVDFL